MRHFLQTPWNDTGVVMAKSSKYVAKQADANGFIRYTDEEHVVWRDLIVPQRERVRGYACQEYVDALARMELPDDHIPQCREVSSVLLDYTGWQVVPVPALIDFTEFFRLLSEKKFPAASFIRSRKEMDYLQEPDIFHEIFGHTPLLTDARYADFVAAYGRAGLSAPKQDHVWLARLFWFTVEFGLITGDGKNEVYGAGIVSSKSELGYSVESSKPDRRPFDIIDVLRTPYRIDILQTVYFVIQSFDELYELANQDLLAAIRRARAMGMKTPTYALAESAA